MKLNITRSQRADSSLVLNLSATSGGDLNPLAIHTAANKSYFGQIEELDSGSIAESQRAAFTRGTSVMANVSGTAIKLFEAAELPVPGAHNIENALAAASASLALGLGPDSIRRGLLAFKGVEHRLEFVVEIDGVRFVNDSKATNIAATRKALEAVDSPVHLIIGGRGKGEDFVTLLPVLSGRALSAVSIGETREEIFSALGRDIPVEFADSMEEAVSKSSKRAKSGETVLLSPACASFDMYQNFEMRGLDFKNIVMTLARRRQEEKVEG